MPGPTYLSSPTVERLPSLMRQIAAGEFRIPRFQRPFVWKDEQRLLLLDSIRQGLPVGSILVWRTSTHKELQEYRHLGPFAIPSASDSGVRTYVIDGHQRLVTLYSALSEPDQQLMLDEPSEDRRDARSVRWPIFYDLKGEKFILGPKRSRIRDEWLPLPRLLDPVALYEFQKRLIARGAPLLATRAEKLAEQFKEYSIPVVPLLTEELGLVTECFRRVNSKGTTMSEVHMLNALSWTKSFDLQKQLQAAKDRLRAVGWGSVDDQVLIDVLKVENGLHYYYATPADLHGVLKDDPGALQRVAGHLYTAAEFLGARCGVRGPLMLPYELQLVLLADASRLLNGPIPKAIGALLEKWFWWTTYTEAFTGRSNRDVQDSVDALRQIVETGAWVALPDEIDVVSPVEHFRPNAVRSRAIVLLLARHGPLRPRGARCDAPRLLGAAGTEAVPKIISPSELPADVDGEGPENRWIVEPQDLDDMRQMLAAPPTADRERVLRSHLISEAAARKLARGDHCAFLEQRRADLVTAERSFVETLGLEYSDAT